MYRGLRVAVVIPAYNEERLIGGAVRSVPDWVDRIIVVDDRSRDGTALAIRRLADPRLSAIHLTRNLGVGGAILTGYREAARLGADVAVVMAGDGQMDPTDLPGLLDPVARGEADYVKGNRLTDPTLLETMPPVRIVGNFALSAMTRVATGYWHVLDSQCGYTALTRPFIERLEMERIYPRYGFPNDLLAHLATLGARVVDRPVRPVYGSERSGIRWPIACFTLPALLSRAWARRVWRMYVRPALGTLAAPFGGRLPARPALPEPRSGRPGD